MHQCANIDKFDQITYVVLQVDVIELVSNHTAYLLLCFKQYLFVMWLRYSYICDFTHW